MQAIVDPLGRKHTYLRISVTDRCNLRCRYCMPRHGPSKSARDDILSFAEITRLAGVFASLGITKLRLTGGEPLVRRNVDRLVRDLARIDGIEIVAMTTNGVYLSEHAAALRAAGLSHLNISLDTLRPERFERLALRDRHHAVRAGIDAALDAGFAPLKLNVVVMGGINDDEVLDFVELARTGPFRVRFIEYMPFAGNGWQEARLVPCSVLRARIEERYRLVPAAPPGGDGQVAKEFRIDGFKGSVGFISPMSDHFCRTCNRLRLMANGALKPCLFGPARAQLREVLRSKATDESLADLIRRAVASKPEAHPPTLALVQSNDRSMVEIGG